MYYIIEIKYVGPNQDQDQFVDADRIEISAVSARTNSSHEVRTTGWCGTNNDWATYAHGAYDSIPEADFEIAKKFGEVRDCEPNGDELPTHDEDIVAVYKPGRFEPMSSQATADWAYEGILADIDDDTTEARIVELVAEYEEEANSNGYTLDRDLWQFMRAHRQEQINNARRQEMIDERI
jgi:hypothetical protein